MMMHSLSNRRWIGILLTFALLFVALPSGASWQCLDGTPCPDNCPMLSSSRPIAGSCANVSGMHCSLCASQAAVCVPHRAHLVVSGHSGRAFSERLLSCPTSHCVLRAAERPASVLQSGVEFPAPLLALPPPSPFVSSLPCLSSSISFTAFSIFHQQHSLSAASGRAPPIVL